MQRCKIIKDSWGFFLILKGQHFSPGHAVEKSHKTISVIRVSLISAINKWPIIYKYVILKWIYAIYKCHTCDTCII